ncbi:MAG: hypothetical protein ACYTXE_46355, partial [Nostoc sp.]
VVTVELVDEITGLGLTTLFASLTVVLLLEVLRRLSNSGFWEVIASAVFILPGFSDWDSKSLSSPDTACFIGSDLTVVELFKAFIEALIIPPATAITKKNPLPITPA